MEGVVKFHHEDGNWHCVEMWKNMHRQNQNLCILGREMDSRFQSSTLLFSMCSDLIYSAVCEIMEQRELDLEDKMVVLLPDFSKHSISHLLSYLNDGWVEFQCQEEQEELSELLQTIGFHETARFMRQSEEAVIRPKRSKKKLLRKKNKVKKRKVSFVEEEVSDWVPDFEEPDASAAASVAMDQNMPIDVKLEVEDDFRSSIEEANLLDDKTGILGEEGDEEVKEPVPVEKIKKRRRRKKIKPPPDELTECPHCHKMLKYKSLYYHTKSCTRAVKREYLLCEFCPFKTVHPDSLKKHLGHRHGGDLPHHCHKCEKKFHKMYDLKLHIREEHDKIYCVCPECGKEYKQKTVLEKHRKSVHSNVHNYQCAMCHGKFKTREAIRKHVVIHGDVEPYKCSVCGLAFRASRSAYIHKMKVHNNEGSVYMQHPKANQILRDKLIMKIEPEIIDRTRKAKPDKTYPLLELSGIKNEDDEIPNLGAVE